jgi:hypothetical protein
MKVYLDVCCLNRPFDNQEQIQVRLETEAILLIIRQAREGKIICVGSDAVGFEIENIVDPQRYQEMLFQCSLTT